jgi:hypothetical protein
MRIVVATPLYPPDIAGPAPYVKEFAKRVSPLHKITIVTYGHLPEQIPDVPIIVVSKRTPLFLRLPLYTATLWKQFRTADIVYVQNGASAELPASILAILSRTPLIFHIQDQAAHERAQKAFVLGLIERFTTRCARSIITTRPESRPEILPFVPPPTAAMKSYEESWERHLAELNLLFAHD